MATLDLLPIICGIIQNELSLSSGQVMIYNQATPAPTSPGLYVVVGHLTGKPIGVTSNVTDEATGISETQTISMREVLKIDLMSIDDSARQSRGDVMMALSGDYAQKTMEANKIQIAKIPSQFNDVSETEGHGRLTRLTMNIVVLAVYVKNKVVTYYDDFSTRSVPPTIVVNE